MMKVALGCDHGGFELKEAIKKYISDKGVEVVDFGTYTTDSVDYPEYGMKVAEAVSKGEVEQGILICGTGLGMSYVANKVKGIRCACVSDVFSAEMSKLHNDANVLALGARVVGLGLGLKIVETWLGTEFEGGRHQRRVDLITAVEDKYFK
ncbi:MAG: ribose 5-phosphate isomerase B [Clostridiales bacterium]|nr:ribose 5-phosphate isomerase B [Clostridiales bacterium]